MEIESLDYQLVKFEHGNEKIFSLAFIENSRVRMWIYFGTIFFISNAVAIKLMVMHMAWAKANSITIELGCEGPVMGFAFLAGIIQILFLRNSDKLSR